MNTTQRHHTLQAALLTGLLLGLGLLNAHAQYTFNSGSDGSYGPMTITTNTTLDLPPNGIFNCTTITIASHATLRFNRNALNTPVYLLATNNIMVNGTIDVRGSAGAAGGPGGYDGGKGVYLSLPAGDGYGPGGGRALISAGAPASYGTAGSSSGPGVGSTYGSPLLVPLAGGSGGSGTEGGDGGGGGGAVLLASNTQIDITGSVTAAGAGGTYFAAGSGGAIRLVAPVVAGAGSLSTGGGATGFGNSGGSGPIRIDCMMDHRALKLALNGVATIGANMVAIPANAPRLDITQVAGTNITVGTSSAVSFTLPQGAPTNQTVTVQANNFGSLVPIRVMLTPGSGLSSSYDTNIDNTISPASVTVPVVVPGNIQVQVNAWTR